MNINEYDIINQKFCQRQALAEIQTLNELRDKLKPLYEKKCFCGCDAEYIEHIMNGDIKQCNCITKLRVDVCLQHAGVHLV